MADDTFESIESETPDESAAADGPATATVDAPVQTPAEPESEYDYGEPDWGDDEFESVETAEADDAGGAESETETQAETAPPAEQWDQLVRAGAGLGMTEAVVKAFGTPDAAYVALRRIYDTIQQQHPQQTSEPPQAPKPQQPPQSQTQQPGELPELDPESYDPALYAHITHYRSRIDALEIALNDVLGHFEQQRQQEFNRQIDALFDGLGEEFVPIVGKGPVAGLTDENAVKNRGRWVATMDALSRRYPEATQEELFRKAMAVEFPDVGRRQERDALRNQLKNRDGMRTAKPAHRERRPLSNEERAVQSVKEYLRSIGDTPDDGDDDLGELV